MNDLNAQLTLLLGKISEESSSARFRLQPQLNSLIHELQNEGKKVVPGALRLNEELRNEAIEAQFDNMPV